MRGLKDEKIGEPILHVLMNALLNISLFIQRRLKFLVHDALGDHTVGKPIYSMDIRRPLHS